MSDMERNEIIDRASAMDLEEQKLFVHQLPVALLYDEIIKRNSALIDGTNEMKRIAVALTEYAR